MLVLQCRTAPASRSNCVSDDAVVDGLKASAAMPMEASRPGIRNVSFNEIGNP